MASRRRQKRPPGNGQPAQGSNGAALQRTDLLDLIKEGWGHCCRWDQDKLEEYLKIGAWMTEFGNSNNLSDEGLKRLVKTKCGIPSSTAARMLKFHAHRERIEAARKESKK